MITQWFDPEPNFILPMAKKLRQYGHYVSVLTGFPNYPGGKIYKGYKIKPYQKEYFDGIPVLRVPLYPSHSNSSIGRIINYFSFAVSAVTVGNMIKGPFDLIYAYHPPVTVGIPSIWFSMIRKIPFVYHILDIWPDSVAESGMLGNKVIIRLLNKWCNYVYKKAAKIVVISPGFKRILCERGVPAEKVEVIYNWCDDNKIFHAPRNELSANKYNFSGKFNIVFAGTMGKAQALDSVMDAAKILEGECPEVQYVFVGDGVESERLKKKKKAMGLNNVLFLDRRPMSEMSEILALADVLFVHLKDEPLYRTTIPGKTQAYLAAGKPILMGVRGDAAELVELAKAGLSCEPENSLSIARVSKQMFNMPKEELELMGKNGSIYYANNLSLEVATKTFEHLFKNTTNLTT